MKKKINLNISFVRAILCIAVLLYHMGYLKGGYLAVCSFFVLTGYFSCISINKIKKYPVIKFYIKRIYGILVPLIIVVFSTLSVMSLLKLEIFNFKPELNSILLNYNNYWQINSNIDYFAKRIDSPFIHLWYISILLQLLVVFPIVYIILKKIGDKVKKIIPCILLFILSIISTIYFYKVSLKGNIMVTYYDTLARSFSFILGVFLGFIHIYYDKLTINKLTNKVPSIIIFISYLIIQCLLFVFISSSSKYFALSMILTSFITLRLIEYGKILYKNNIIIKLKTFKFISDISYEVYLVQYPVIYIFNNINISGNIKTAMTILTIIFISWTINESLNIFKKVKLRYLRLLLFIPVACFTIYGGYKYIVMKDYTKELNDLKEELANNEKMMQEKQNEYIKNQQDKEDEWNKYLTSLEVDEKELKKYVSELKIVGIGDSIMLDAVNHLYRTFPNAYFDAKISRNACAAGDVLQSIKDKGIKWDVLVFSLGTNGYPTVRCKDRLLQIAGDVKIFWINATNPDYSINNAELIKYANNHSNIYVLDWESVVKDHKEYLYSDYIHLKPGGMQPYADFIKEEIFKVYKAEYDKEKEKLIKKHEEELKDNISFYGNEILINAFDLLQDKFPNAKFEAKADMNYSSLKDIINKEIDNNKLNKKIVLVFDKNNNLTKEEYEDIIKLCKDNNIYILTLDNMSITGDNVTMINLNLTKSDYMADSKHLTDDANKKLVNILVDTLNKKE